MRKSWTLVGPVVRGDKGAHFAIFDNVSKEVMDDGDDTFC